LFLRQLYRGHTNPRLREKEHENTQARNSESRIVSSGLFEEEREKGISDLKKYIAKRKKTDKEFATGFDEGYEQFKIGFTLRQARETAGLTQAELALRLKTQKTAISRIENHAEDIKLSTLDRVAKALGKRLEVHIG
jgi:HTH-type transcriptional regulator/antitoxin HipB